MTQVAFDNTKYLEEQNSISFTESARTATVYPLNHFPTKENIFDTKINFLSKAFNFLYAVWNKKVSTKELIFLTITLASLQFLDGLLTTIGVVAFGSGMEANLLIRNLIEMWGTLPALLFVKTLAIIIVLSLAFLSRKVDWLASAMKCIIVVYIFAAILPWTIILSLKA